METFRKQNLNFLEILFTDYSWINPLYEEQWNRLVQKREEIARMNEVRAVKSMKGVAMEKYHAMEHPYPNKLEVLNKFGYDPKQLHHLLRVEEYLRRYINGESYADCLIPANSEYLINVKKGMHNLDTARKLANISAESVCQLADSFRADREEVENEDMRALLEDVSYEIMKIAVEKELRV